MGSSDGLAGPSTGGGRINTAADGFPGSRGGTERCCMLCASICGVILIVLGGCAWLLLAPVLYNGIIAQNFVTSPSSPGFAAFQTSWTGSDNDVPQLELFWFYNLTNANAVVSQRQTPNYQEVGPLGYRVNTTKLNLFFNADNTLVSFQRFKVYAFQSDISAISPAAPITNVNPAYISSVIKVGGETTLNYLMGSVALATQILPTIEAVYINGSLINNVTDYSYWLTRCQQIDPACNSTADMALVQWGFFNSSFIGLNNMRVSTALPGVFPYPAEYFVTGGALAVRLNGTFPIGIAAAKQMLNNPAAGLYANPAAFAQFSALCTAGNGPAVLATWGLTIPQCTIHLGYITAQINGTYTDNFMVNTIFAGQGGLITTRPAASVLFGAKDALLTYLTPATPFVAFFKNATTEAAGFTTMQTGLNDVFQVGNVTSWNNSTTFPWPSGVATVAGNFGNQFPPGKFNGKGGLLPAPPLPSLPVWSSNHGRAILFEDSGSVVEINGVEAHQMALSSTTYNASSLYAIPPSHIGFVNATLMNAGTPLYYCQPHMYLVDGVWPGLLQGIVPPNPAVDNSFVWLEPITGLAFAANVSLQLNVYVDAATAPLYNRYNRGFSTGVMYPLVYTLQSTTGTQTQGDQVNESVYRRVQLINTIFAVCLGIGTVCLVSVGIWVYNELRRTRVGYSEL